MQEQRRCIFTQVCLLFISFFKNAIHTQQGHDSDVKPSPDLRPRLHETGSLLTGIKSDTNTPPVNATPSDPH